MILCHLQTSGVGAIVILSTFGIFMLAGIIVGIASYNKEYRPVEKILARAEYVFSRNKVGILNALNMLPYFRKLSSGDQKVFITRVKLVLSGVTYVDSKGHEVPDTVKVSISGALVQLTFGLKKVVLRSFTQIIVYENAYYSRRTGKYHKGDVDTIGRIRLSFVHYLEGMVNDTDRLNLGLHEMAHALFFQVYYDQKDDEYPLLILERIRKIGHDVYKEESASGKYGLRDYAYTNIKEFFAVAVEHFFEAPAYLREKYPDLYRSLCFILNQDPAEGFVKGVSVKTLKPQKEPGLLAQVEKEARVFMGKPELTDLAYSAVMVLLAFVLLASGSTLWFLAVVLFGLAAFIAYMVFYSRKKDFYVCSDRLIVQDQKEDSGTTFWNNAIVCVDVFGESFGRIVIWAAETDGHYMYKFPLKLNSQETDSFITALRQNRVFVRVNPK